MNDSEMDSKQSLGKTSKQRQDAVIQVDENKALSM